MDDAQLESVVVGEHQKIVADKAYWNARRLAWLAERGWANGILKRGTAALSLWMSRRNNAIANSLRSVRGLRKYLAGGSAAAVTGEPDTWVEIPIGWNWSLNASVGT